MLVLKKDGEMRMLPTHRFVNIEETVVFLRNHPEYEWIVITTYKNGVKIQSFSTLAGDIEHIVHTLETCQRRIENMQYVRDSVTREILMDRIDSWSVSPEK